jgi:DNA-binding MarR family transcriptional regulator
MQPESEKAADNPFASSLYFSSSALARATERLALECFKPLGLSPSLAYILLVLESVRVTSPSFLAKTLFLHPSTMTRLLAKLEKMGLVDLFTYDRIRMVKASLKAWDMMSRLLDCELAFLNKCNELFGSESVRKLTRAMNYATDKIRSGTPDRSCHSDDKISGEKRRSSHIKTVNMDTPDTRRMVEAAYLQKAISYDAYTALFDELVAGGKTTGPDESDSLVHYTVLNQQRMHRWEKTIQLLPAVESAMRGVTLPQTWLVLTEAWCGDAAHSIPVLHALAAQNPLITLCFVFRDENPELMDRYLTNGVSRSIPKLIAVDTATHEELFTWGPRPAPLQAIFMKMRDEGLAYGAIKEELQRWYNKDKSITIQEEMAALASATYTDMGMTA